jgi:hypothetical protein
MRYETLASDALVRLAHMLGVPNVVDDPEQAFIAAIERAVGELVDAQNGATQKSTSGDPACTTPTE